MTAEQPGDPASPVLPSGSASGAASGAGRGAIAGQDGNSPAGRAFRAEVRRATSYENGLAVKALVALVLVAALVAMRLAGF